MIGHIRRRSGGAHGGGGLDGGYVIDQTGLTTTKSDEMITVGNGVFARINQIHDNSHLYAGGLVNGVFTCKQLSDTDKTLYADGTPLVLGADENVFMKLPQFWWKAIPDPDNADICEVDFTMDNPNDNSWYEWEGNTFIGAYKGVVIDSKLRSKAGELISNTTGEYTRTGRANYKTYARNNGTGYSCLTYEVVQIIALLGFGWLKTLSSISVFGQGSNTKFTSGVCDSLGMADGKSSNYTNFWGLEAYISGSGLHEYIDNISVDSTKMFSILDTSDDSVIRTVQAGSDTTGNRWIKKVVLGEHADIFAKETSTSRLGTDTQYVCYININTNSPDPYFLNNTANSNSGFVGMGFGYNAVTSRLCYKGNYTIIS